MANMGCPDVHLQVILLGFIAPTHTPEELKTHFKFQSLYATTTSVSFPTGIVNSVGRSLEFHGFVSHIKCCLVWHNTAVYVCPAAALWQLSRAGQAEDAGPAR